MLLSAACWAFTFGLDWGNFWIKIGLSVVAICLYSLIWQKPQITFNIGNIAIGILSAGVLYGIFFLGNTIAHDIIPRADTEVRGIYNLGTGTAKFLIFMLLLFVTGPGEEIFWRGFLQGNLMQRFGDIRGFIIGTIIYGSVHVFSMNFMLVMASLVAGAFWGALYLWKRDLGLVIVSHSIWSVVIFTILPIR
jgi:membrane protease YdiL (CAAX protease family)